MVVVNYFARVLFYEIEVKIPKKKKKKLEISQLQL